VNKIVIGITGLKGSGKDTFARKLWESYNFYPYAFAQPLKSMMFTLLANAGMRDHDINDVLYGARKEEVLAVLGGRSARHAMQTLGTEWRDLIHPELWTTILHHKLEAAQAGRFVITDVRFPHEVKMIKSFGGKTIRIVRPGLVPDLHPSEAQIPTLPVDLEIQNDSTIPALYAKCEGALKELGVLK
jgi:hypothetical protein